MHIKIYLELPKQHLTGPHQILTEDLCPHNDPNYYFLVMGIIERNIIRPDGSFKNTNQFWKTRPLSRALFENKKTNERKKKVIILLQLC